MVAFGHPEKESWVVNAGIAYDPECERRWRMKVKGVLGFRV